MYAITGITGKVGGELARTLLAAGQPVRAIVRDAGRGRAWVAQGCELALANMTDRAALTNAFNPEPRIRTLDGFNEGWIEFRNGGDHAIKGRIDAVSVVADLVAEACRPASTRLP